jgi:hypothetical protein
VPKQAKQRSKQHTTGKATPKPVGPTANLNDLRRRANQGDPAAQANLCRALDANPAIWRRLGDLATHAQLEFVRMIAGGDFLLGESIKRRIAELRTELLGVFPTPLETLAVDRLIAARMYVEHVESQCAKAEGEIPLAKFWLARERQAHNLYHSAVRSLLLVRTLLPPAEPPPALSPNGTATKLNGNGRLAIGVNGDGSSYQRAAASTNRVNGSAKSGRRRELATA